MTRTQTPPTPLHPDIAEHIGDGSEHAEQMPGYAVSILDEIAEAQRTTSQSLRGDYIAGLTAAYRAVMQHRFALNYPRHTGGRNLIDTWTGDDLMHFFGATADQALDTVVAANQRNADVFAARIDRDITEGGL